VNRPGHDGQAGSARRSEHDARPGDDAALLAAVAEALTGQRPFAGAAAGSPQEAVEVLADLGFDAVRLQQVRRLRQEASEPWPFEVDRELLRRVGFARFGAVLARVRQLTGTDGLVPTVHEGPRVIGPAEQRLLAEVPPHHGRVG